MLRPTFMLAALASLAAISLAGPTPASGETLTPPTTEQVLLSAPEPSEPTARGIFLADPGGQVELIAATGHLVAWTVRTPADRGYAPSLIAPKTIPVTTRLVIVDERGGAPLTVDFPARWISHLRAFRGQSGAADPRFAVRSCTSLKASSCTAEVLAVTPGAPLAVVSRTSDRLATAAVAGRLDSGQRLLVGPKPRRGKDRKCRPRLSVRQLDSGTQRDLPKISRDPDHGACFGVTSAWIHGRYAFASLSFYSRYAGVGAEFLYGLDLKGGAKARWRELQRVFAESEYTDFVALGPGVTDDALYFTEQYIDDIPTLWLAQVVLPRDVQRAPISTDAIWSDPISSSSDWGCAVAATDDAIYELMQKSCKDRGEGPGEIRRIVNPAFKPGPTP